MEGFGHPGDSVESLRSNNTLEVTERLIEHEFALVGPVDEIKRQLESLSQCRDNANHGSLEWFNWQRDQGYMLLEETMAKLEIFGTPSTSVLQHSTFSSGHFGFRRLLINIWANAPPDTPAPR